MKQLTANGKGSSVLLMWKPLYNTAYNLWPFKVFWRCWCIVGACLSNKRCALQVSAVVLASERLMAVLFSNSFMWMNRYTCRIVFQGKISLHARTFSTLSRQSQHTAAHTDMCIRPGINRMANYANWIRMNVWVMCGPNWNNPAEL